MNLLKEILDRLDFERLISEGRDPIEVLRYKYSNVPSDVIDAVISIDPTKKKSYSQWLLSKWDDESYVIVNNLKNGRIKKLFDHYKNHTDIQIKDCPSVEDGLRDFVPNVDTVLDKSSAPTTYVHNLHKEVSSELANDFDIVYEDDDWIIAVPNTYEASCKLGENMHWCTANCFGNGESYYRNYLSSGGKYYVNFDLSEGESRGGKDYPYTRYQFHFESNQFMNSDDNRVDLKELGMPDEALEFYEEEGYDIDNLESDEERWERYEEDRWRTSYSLTDEIGLCLMIGYDDNYEMETVDEDTKFYLYDDNDSVDPLVYEEVRNPHLNDDVIIENGEKHVILNCYYDDKKIIALAFNDGVNSYRVWHATCAYEYIELPYKYGYFGLSTSRYFYYASFKQEEQEYKKVRVQSEGDVAMAVNEQLTNERDDDLLFVETIHDGGLHSLFALSEGGDLDCIVKQDIPKNGEYFTFNEKGEVEGRFRNYRVKVDVIGDDEYGEIMNWHYEKDLPNGDILISKENPLARTDENKVYGIVRSDTKEMVMELWFDGYVGTIGNLHLIRIGKEYASFSTVNGKQIGYNYSHLCAIDKERGILMGSVREIRDTLVFSHLIDANTCEVILEFKSALSSGCYNCGKIIVLEKDESTKCFDYINRQYCMEGVMFMRLYSYNFPNLFFCKSEEYPNGFIYDLETDEVKASNFTSIRELHRHQRGYTILVNEEGKENVFSLTEFKEMLPNYVDKITSCGESDFKNDKGLTVVYRDNGKYYVYDIEANQYLFDGRGFDVPVTISETGVIYFQWLESKDSKKSVEISFSKTSPHEDYNFYSWVYTDEEGRYRASYHKRDMPIEVINVYNMLFSTSNSVSESFKNMMDRLDEARRLTMLDLLD